MSEPGEGAEYELKSPEPEPAKPKPGDPDWVPPIPVIEKADPVEPEMEEEPLDPDVQNHKAVAILAYIFFVIPLVAAPHSKYARFHANQGLMLFIMWVIAIIGVVVLNVGWAVLGHYLDNIGILHFFFGCFATLVPVILMVGVFAYTIIGIIQAANGETKGLPLIGHWKLIK